jgi:putative DNA primase/helicase
MSAIRLANTPPTLFQRGGVLTRIRTDEHDAPWLEPLDQAALRGHLARVADWVRQTTNGVMPTPPPMPLVAAIQSLGEWERIPVLKGIVEAPTFSPDGLLLTVPGYHAAAQLCFHAAKGFYVPNVSPAPSPVELQAAVTTLDDLLADFPFQDQASRAHALAAMLLPFARDLIDGLTPLHLITAPTPGTGKGLLAEVVSIPATGRGPDVMIEGRDDDEWRKRITAALVKGSPFLLIDNIRNRLDAAALAGALTATPAWTDRILGKSLTVTLPVRVVWLATGNNVLMSHEMSRRTVLIRIDSKVERPWMREGQFRHSNLAQWARENRGRLVHACLTLIQGWIAEGRPTGGASLGRFEQWADILGGILKVAGVRGFLSNANDLYAEADDETRPWREFVNAWWQEHQDKPVGVEALFKVANGHELLGEVLGDGGDRSQRTKLGRAMGQMKDRIIDGVRIVSIGVDHRGRQQYRLDRTDRGLTSADMPPTSAP